MSDLLNRLESNLTKEKVRNKGDMMRMYNDMRFKTTKYLKLRAVAYFKGWWIFKRKEHISVTIKCRVPNTYKRNLAYIQEVMNNILVARGYRLENVHFIQIYCKQEESAFEVLFPEWVIKAPDGKKQLSKYSYYN